MDLFIILILLLLLILYRPDKELSELKMKYDFSHSTFQTVLIDNQEINIHYRDEGDPSSHVIILLHGMFSSLQTFDEWASLLLQSGYRVIRIDLPNHGASGSFSDHVISLRRSALVVKAIVDHLQLQALSIGGNSMGGGVSWYFSALYHESIHIRHLILIDSVSPLNAYRNSSKWRDFMNNTFLGKVMCKLTPKFLFVLLLKFIYGSGGTLTQKTIDRYYDFLLLEGNREAIVTSKAEPSDELMSVKALEIIQSATIPTLIMWGKEDRLIPISTIDEFQALFFSSHTEIKIYETLGHLPMEEDSLMTFNDLSSFLRKHS